MADAPVADGLQVTEDLSEEGAVLETLLAALQACLVWIGGRAGRDEPVCALQARRALKAYDALMSTPPVERAS